MKAQQETIQVKLYVHAIENNISRKMNITVLPHDASKHGNASIFGTVVAIHDIEIPYPNISRSDFINSQIDTLKKEQNKVLTEAHAKASELEDRIQSLLCIEEKPISKSDEEIPY
ncbi:hypothetical protein TI10_05390 [Photorhabdus luminescens subsp. luminescens]|uniref:Uncharacterized protein n=1 Tax=Photorhabdus luminescens TaxID=29488 RepID=A0A1G5Q1C0_PHOLU|nr:hypothetical protein [Photorhabdus luminescens]KMW73679.1 hypothetical protein TI10_05390 [Photorhabdus luminescens subsp. luminescens]SCZ55675.1 hypothetical protein SAMN02982990_00792 [Photorhabdus luminescens]